MEILYFSTWEESKREYDHNCVKDDDYVIGLLYGEYQTNKFEIEEWFKNNNIPFITLYPARSMLVFKSFDDALLFKLAWE